jgi:hydroxypyruvate isomerase
MPKFAANLSTLFTEYPFLERFSRARDAGFSAVEFQFPYEFDAAAIAAELSRNSLELVLFNLPAGNFAAGDRGMANDPARTADFRASLETALHYAADLSPRKLNCLVGKRLPNTSLDEQRSILESNLRIAADAAADAGIRLVIEPLNVYDAPGFFLSTPASGFDLVERVNHHNLTVQFDIYHAQRMTGNIVATFADHLTQIGHVQLADSPGRHQPGSGEINFPYVLQQLDNAGYNDWVGLEYFPSTSTEDSLAWLTEMGYWPTNEA